MYKKYTSKEENKEYEMSETNYEGGEEIMDPEFTPTSEKSAPFEWRRICNYFNKT